jgi:lactose/L-arabinose transport system substrate-binding protein
VSKQRGRHNLTRRRFIRNALGGALGVSLLGASGCAGGVGATDLTVASWNTAADALSAVVPAYSERRPEVGVRVQYITTEYTQLIPRLMADSGAPDVFSVAQQDFQTLLSQFPGQFADVTDFMSGRRDEFVDAAYDSTVRDGRVYGVPWDIGPVGLYYRKDLFEEAGIGPEALATYDGFIEAGKELSSALDGVSMTGLDVGGQGTNPSDYTIFLNQQGGQFLTDDGRIDFTGEASLRAVELIRRMNDEGVAVNAASYDDTLRNITNGRVATSIGAVWTSGTLSGSVPDQAGEWGITKLPAFEEGGPRDASLAGSVLVISSQTEKTEAAWEFIEEALLTSSGQHSSWDNGLFPSWRPYWETGRFRETDDYFDLSIGDVFSEIADGSPALDYGPNFLDFRSPLLDAIGSAVTGGVPVEEAMSRAEERAARASGLKIGG